VEYSAAEHQATEQAATPQGAPWYPAAAMRLSPLGARAAYCSTSDCLPSFLEGLSFIGRGAREG
jgi:hypothetical protein